MLYFEDIDNQKLNQRKYSDEEREKAITQLDLNGQSLRKTSKDTGVNRYALRRWNQQRDGDQMEEFRKVKRAEFIEKAWRVVNKGIATLQDKITEGNLKDVATTVAILVDKIQALSKVEAKIKLSEEKTRSLEVSNMSDEELEHYLRRLSNSVSGDRPPSSATQHQDDDATDRGTS